MAAGAIVAERSAIEEIGKLRRMTWTQLTNYALRNGFLSVRQVREAKTRDELRLAILKAQFPEVAP